MDRLDPPRWAERFLRWWLPPGIVGNSILGDAREEFAEQVRGGGKVPSWIWYWAYATKVALHYVWDSSTEESSEEKNRSLSPGERASELLREIKSAAKWGVEVEIGTLINDMRYGARALLKQPGSALISVLVLALGIGLSTFMFSLIYGVFFRGLDVPEASQLMMIYRGDEAQSPRLVRTPELA